MSYESRQEQATRDEKYEALKSRKVNITKRVGDWVAEATSLHASSPDQSEKDDVLALRADFIAILRGHLGV